MVYGPDVVTDIYSEVQVEYCSGHESDGAPVIVRCMVGLNTFCENRFSMVEITRFARWIVGLAKRKHALPNAVSGNYTENQ